MTDIKTINLGSVNAYLVRTQDSGFILIDTGMPGQPAGLEKGLAGAGCQPGDLKLIILTHGDFDHVGNAPYLRTRYGAPIAMHPADAGMVERGDISSSRKARPDRISPLGRVIMFTSRLLKSAPPETFKPDVYVEDGQDLSEYGLDARVIHIPGHSKGSIGILTSDGALFCGDLFAMLHKPALHFIIDDMPAAQASLDKLRGLPIQTVYPGHFGQSFPIQAFWNK